MCLSCCESVSTLGDRIRSARQARGMKQEDLAAAAGISVTALRQWENGHVASPQKLGLLEAVLGQSLRADQRGDPTPINQATTQGLMAALASRVADLVSELQAAHARIAELEGRPAATPDVRQLSRLRLAARHDEDPTYGAGPVDDRGDGKGGEPT